MKKYKTIEITMRENDKINETENIKINEAMNLVKTKHNYQINKFLLLFCCFVPIIKCTFS